MLQQGPQKISIHPPLYGTFSSSYPPQPSIPPPYTSPHPGFSVQPPLPPFHHSHPTYHAIPVGYQSYEPVVDGIPLREPLLPCCGIGIGWILFLAGFFFAGIPWYVGAFILLFVGVDYRERAGLIACTVGAILVVITLILGVSHGNLDW